MTERPINSFAVFFSRLTWMIFGPVMLLLVLSAISRTAESAMSVADFVFFGILAAMIACRFYEFRTGQALTASGDPMTHAIVVRYSLIVVLLGVVAFAIVKTHALGLLQF
jgi:hypothetical protein